jgi:histidinol-phosphate aminotransferase
LDLNEVPYPPSPKVIEAVSREAIRLNRYPEPDLKKVLIDKLAKYNGVSSENIVVTCGADLILQYLFYIVGSPGSKVIVPYPAFFAYDKMFSMLGLKVTRIALKDEGDHWRLPLDDIVAAIESDDTRLVVIDNPNNPTGSLLIETEAHAKRVLDTASAKGALVIFDEAYYEFSRVSFARLVESYDNIAVVRTMSKAFGLAGARVGYAILPKRLAELLSAILPPFPPRLSIVAAIAALEDLEYSTRLVETVSRERERVRSELSKIRGVKVYKSYTNFLLVRTGVSNIVGKLEEKGIAVRSVPLGSEWARISVGSREENEMLISALRSIVEG